MGAAKIYMNANNVIYYNLNSLMELKNSMAV